MNWLTEKFQRFKPKIKNLFRVKIGPEGKLWEGCKCGAVIYKQDLKENLFVCPKCSDHHRLAAPDRLSIFLMMANIQKLNT